MIDANNDSKLSDLSDGDDDPNKGRYHPMRSDSNESENSDAPQDSDDNVGEDDLPLTSFVDIDL